MDQLEDEITEMFSNNKTLKFNTHKNRKIFISNLIHVMKNYINENTTYKNQNLIRNIRSAITHPRTDGKPSVGYAIMTEGESSQNDEIHKKHGDNNG